MAKQIVPRKAYIKSDGTRVSAGVTTVNKVEHALKPSVSALKSVSKTPKGNFTAIDTVRQLLHEQGIELKTKRYDNGEYAPWQKEISLSANQIMVPLTLSGDNPRYIEETIIEEIEVSDYEEEWIDDEDHEDGGYWEVNEVSDWEEQETMNPDWYPGVNDLFDPTTGELNHDVNITFGVGGELRKNLELGQKTVDAFRSAGFKVSWGGTTNDDIVLMSDRTKPVMPPSPWLNR